MFQTPTKIRMEINLSLSLSIYVKNTQSDLPDSGIECKTKFNYFNKLLSLL